MLPTICQKASNVRAQAAGDRFRRDYIWYDFHFFEGRSRIGTDHIECGDETP